MIFLTVGTVFGFDRLARAVDEACAQGIIQEPVLGQLASGRYRPRHFEWTGTLPKSAYDRRVADASALIGHAGMGVLTAAFDKAKPLLVLARRKRYGEVVNDHQVAIAEQLARLGHILYASDETELMRQLAVLTRFVPEPRVSHADAVTVRIARFLEQVEALAKDGQNKRRPARR